MKIEYKNRLIAFIDVLGFKNLVFATQLEAIETYYKFLLSNFAEGAEKRRLEYLLISDSIVVFCDDSTEDLFTLIKFIGLLQSGLLTRGIIVRGAISHGNLFVDKDNSIIVGPGLVNAYALEATAKYPRVIIDRKIIEKYYGSTISAIENSYSGSRPNLSIKPHNGGILDHLYLHYGRIVANGVSAKHYAGIIKFFKKEFYKNEHIEKFEWLRKYLISSLEESVAYLSAKDNPTTNERAKLKNNRRCIVELSVL